MHIQNKTFPELIPSLQQYDEGGYGSQGVFLYWNNKQNKLIANFGRHAECYQYKYGSGWWLLGPNHDSPLESWYVSQYL